MREKLKEKIKCILCRTQICGVKQQLQWKESSRDFKLWDEQCLNSLSEILFKTQSHPYKYLLSSGGYCFSCQKTVWDLDFTHRQIQKLKIRMDELTKGILNSLQTNYETSVEERLQGTFESKDDGCTNRRRRRSTLDFVKSINFHYDEAIEVIYDVLTSEQMFKGINPPARNRSTKPTKGSPLLQPEVKTNDTPWDSLNFDLLKNSPNSIDIKDEVVCEDVNNLDDNDCFDPFEEIDQCEPSNPDFPGKLEEDDLVENPSVNTTTTTDEIPMDSHVPDVPGPSHSSQYRNDSDRDSASITSEDEDEEDETFSMGSNSDVDYSDDNRKKSKKKLEPRVKKFKCVVEECPKIYYTRGQMNTHYKTFHLGEKGKHQCDKCEKKYRNPFDLRRHMEEIHTNERLGHACPVCSKSFETLPELDSHSVIHKGDNPFTCEDCHKEFSYPNELKRHVNETHAVVSHPKCSVCGKQFRTAHRVKQHELSVHPEVFGKILKCGSCDATFETAKLRYEHRRTVHKRTFQCDYCGKSFPRINVLKTHLSTHTGDRPFKCKLCDASFKQPSNLRRHEKRHSGVYNFVCDKCGKAFTTKDNLVLHKGIHERDPNYRPRKPKPSLNDMLKAKQSKELIGNEEPETL